MPELKNKKKWMSKIVLLILLGCSLLATESQAQSLVQLQGKSIPELKREQHTSSTLLFSSGLQHFAIAEKISSDNPASINLRQQLLSPSSTPSAYCYQELAFFCKLEVQMEKAASFPIKFRLGEVQYVDQLEGKLPILFQVK